MQLDSRTWLIWGFAASLPVVISRNPFLLTELLIIMLIVRAASPRASEGTWMIRIVSIFILVSVVFNLLTVHSGNLVIAELPDRWPIIGGIVTWNGLVYGVVSGLAIFVMIVTWTLVATHLRWSALTRQLPPRLTPFAVAGSVAWSYLPRMRDTLHDIRESQRSRGWQPSRVRDLPAIVVPLLVGGLERSLITAEVLEARGFGGSPTAARQTSLAASWMLLAGLVLIVSAVYCLVVGQMPMGGLLGIGGIGMLVTNLQRSPRINAPTRLRDEIWTRSDSTCCVASGIAVLIVIGRLFTSREGFEFNPYPTMSMPIADPLLMSGLLLLFAPVFVTAIGER